MVTDTQWEFRVVLWGSRPASKGGSPGDKSFLGLCSLPVCVSTPASFHPLPAPGDNIPADGNVDLNRLEVSLTLTSKFEALELDAEKTTTQGLLLRWVKCLSVP